MELTKNLLRLATGDLESARVLYDQQQFRNSYFCFQQATEKANKALGLEQGIIQEKDLQAIGHKQLEIYKKITNEQFKKLKTLVNSTTEISLKDQDL